ncbi:EamA family transporter [Streptomyces heilongjiangensis]
MVGAVFAHAVRFRGVERLPAVVTSVLGLFSPVVATLLGPVVLGQGLTPPQLAGAAAVPAGIVLARLPALRPARPQRKESHEHRNRPGRRHQVRRTGVPSA